jgi:hypothetical protein
MPIRLCQHFLQGLKPAFFAGLIGTAEAVPFQKACFGKPIYETSSTYLGEYRRSALVLTAQAEHLFLQEGNLL